MSGDKRDTEVLALRRQILVLQRQIERPRFTPTDRTILSVLTRAFDRRRLDPVMLIVKPVTVIIWHRRFVDRHWTQPPQPQTGYPDRAPTSLGHRIAASTVSKILRESQLDRSNAPPPAPA